MKVGHGVVTGWGKVEIILPGKPNTRHRLPKARFQAFG